MDLTLTQYIIAIGGGFFAGIINTLAGNGSAITLTILIEVLGLPPLVANATNRVGICSQSIAGSIAFYRNDKLPIHRSRWLIILIVIGAIIGMYTVTQVDNQQFRNVFRYLMIVMLFVILVNPKRWLQESDLTKDMSWWLAVPLFLGLGFYGGFIQMGMGVFFLATMVLVARYEIIEANAVKSFVIAIYTILAIAFFHWKGLIDWKTGLIVAIGQTIGGWITAQYASTYPKANLWAYRLLVVTMIFAILKLFGVLDYFFK